VVAVSIDGCGLHIQTIHTIIITITTTIIAVTITIIIINVITTICRCMVTGGGGQE
jgi:hypothetical protein